MLDLNAIFDGDDPLPTGQAPAVPQDLPVEWWLVWDERAAIKEYDGDMPRERAEAEALTETVELMMERKKTQGP